MTKSRRRKFDAEYGAAAPVVLSSIARVARAGRTEDQARIDAERQRHYRLMQSLS